MSTGTLVRKKRRIDSGTPLLVLDPPDEVDAYAVLTAICDNPECTCTTMQLGIRPAWRNENGSFDTAGPILKGTVSWEGTELSFEENQTGRFSGEVIAWLRDRLAEEDHRGWLQERWRRSRGQVGDPGYPSGIPPRDVEGLVFFDDVFPYDFDLVVFHQGRGYLAADQYCLEPGCTCEDAVVCFAELDGRRRALGAVRAPVRHLQRARVIDGPAVIRHLWSALLDQHDPPPLRERFRRMRDVARLWGGMPEPYLRVQPKIGRNEPCPCGSGRKFKRCCGS